MATFDPEKIYFSTLSKLRHSRAVFRESMRLYPPVPMYVREARKPARLRDRVAKRGAQIILSPWHLHRHQRLWDRPDEFDPGRFDTPNGKECLRSAYIPFSAGQRVCPGSAFAMAEGPLLLSMLVRNFRFTLTDGPPPHANGAADSAFKQWNPPQTRTPEPRNHRGAETVSKSGVIGQKPLHAWPYWITITFVPLVLLALTQGGRWIASVPFYGWVLMPLLDTILGKDLRNPDPDTSDSELFWFRLLTWIWFPIQAALVFGSIGVLTGPTEFSTLETLGIMFGIGVTTGTVGIAYSHELMHKSGRFERALGDLLLALVLYGHFRTEHLLVHHPHVGTPRDTVTARYKGSIAGECGILR